MNKLMIKLLGFIILISLMITVISINHKEHSSKQAIETIATINQIQDIQLDNLENSGICGSQVKAKWAITYIEQNILTGQTKHSVIRSDEIVSETSLSKL